MRRLAWIALLIWIAVTAFVTAHHEPWRDEADAWLIARDNDLAGIVRIAPYVGVPAMWDLLVAPLPRLGAPYAAQNWLNLLLAAGAVALLLFKSPLPMSTKLLVAFSYYLAYEYAAIARPYALSILLLFAAAALFDRPVLCPLLIALSMSVNAHATVLAVAMAVAWLIERRDAHRHAWIIAAGLIAAFLQMRTPPDAQRIEAFATINLPALPFTLGHAFLPTIPMIAGAPIAVIVLALVASSLRRSRAALAMLGLAVGGLLFLAAFVWLGGLRHAGFVLIAVVLALWIGGAANRTATIALNATLAVSLIIAVSYWYDEYTSAFSGSKEMGAVLRRYEKFDIAAHGLVQCEAVVPYLGGKRLWYIGRGEYGTHMRWDRAQDAAVDVPYPEAVARARAHLAGKPWVLLLNVEMPSPEANGFRLLYATRRRVFEKTDERYWLYQPMQ